MASLPAKRDGLGQPTGERVQLTPSVFVKATVIGGSKREIPADPGAFFKCPACGHTPMNARDEQLICDSYGKKWGFKDNIYDFREAVDNVR
jgi:hypothetical protein